MSLWAQNSASAAGGGVTPDSRSAGLRTSSWGGSEAEPLCGGFESRPLTLDSRP